jgi:polyhydroxyalkanoate synthesis regulator phasin
MPSRKKQNKPAKPRPKKQKKSSELDSVLDQVNDSTVADAKKELQNLLADAKGDSATFFQQNAQKLEERLVLVSKGELDQDDFNFFVESQKRAAQIFIDSQPPQAQERAEKLTIHLLEVAATKIVPVLIAAALYRQSDSITASDCIFSTTRAGDYAAGRRRDDCRDRSSSGCRSAHSRPPLQSPARHRRKSGP